MSAEVERVDYEYAVGVRLVLGKPDGHASRTVNIYDRAGKLQTAFTVTHSGSMLTVTSQPARNDFEIQLPFANDIQRLEGGTRISQVPSGHVLVGDPGGVVIKASSPELKVTWI